MPKFTTRITYDGTGWEVVMQNHTGGRKAYQPRRIALCTHEDDAKCIAEAMEHYEAIDIASTSAEYWIKGVLDGKA